MEEEKGKEEAEDWKIYEALCSKTPTEVSCHINYISLIYIVLVTARLL